jgi:hypothetical protein
MNGKPPQSTSIWKREFLPGIGLVRFFRWLFRWRTIRRGLFYFACAATLVVLLYAEENWRGHRAWENYKRQSQAKGAKFDRASFIPPPVPDGQNFAMTPFLVPLFDFEPETQQRRDTNGLRRIDEWVSKTDATGADFKSSGQPRTNSWSRPAGDVTALHLAILEEAAHKAHATNETFTNLTPSEKAARVLSHLAAADPVLDELRGASARPYSRFNLRYENEDPAAILLPHLSVLKHLCIVLQVRASAELVLGRAEDAFNDLALLFRLIKATQSEPILISQLVRLAEAQIVLNPIAQGLEARQWSEPQLRALQQQLQALDFCTDIRRALDGERGFFGSGILDYFRRSSSVERSRLVGLCLDSLSLEGGSSPNQVRSDAFWTGLWVGAAPSGWLDFEAVNYDRAFQEYVLPAIDSEHGVVNPAASERAAALREAQTREYKSMSAAFRHHQFFARLMLFSATNTVQNTARAQTGIELAALACALERHRLAHGEYPATLDALVPEFIARVPHEVVNGQPLRYQFTDKDHFRLYSVGWNQKDEGGTIVLTNGGGVDWQRGDWVWQ